MCSYLSHQPLVKTGFVQSWQSIYCLCTEIMDVGRGFLHRVRNLCHIFKTFFVLFTHKQNVHSKFIIQVLLNNTIELLFLHYHNMLNHIVKTFNIIVTLNVYLLYSNT